MANVTAGDLIRSERRLTMASALNGAGSSGGTPVDMTSMNQVLGDQQNLNKADLQFQEKMNQLHFDKKTIDADTWQ
jgi:hypothetical protein